MLQKQCAKEERVTNVNNFTHSKAEFMVDMTGVV